MVLNNSLKCKRLFERRGIKCSGQNSLTQQSTILLKLQKVSAKRKKFYGFKIGKLGNKQLTERGIKNRINLNHNLKLVRKQERHIKLEDQVSRILGIKDIVVALERQNELNKNSYESLKASPSCSLNKIKEIGSTVDAVLEQSINGLDGISRSPPKPKPKTLLSFTNTRLPSKIGEICDVENSKCIPSKHRYNNSLHLPSTSFLPCQARKSHKHSSVILPSTLQPAASSLVHDSHQDESGCVIMNKSGIIQSWRADSNPLKNRIVQEFASEYKPKKRSHNLRTIKPLKFEP